MIKVDKTKQKDSSKSKKVENKKRNKDHEDYGYDFVPNLDEWLNIDEQREKADELENM